MRIAQRFIAGVRSLPPKSRRDGRTRWLECEQAERYFFRPDGTFFVLGGGPAMNRWAIFGRPSGTPATDPVVPSPGWACDNLDLFQQRLPGMLINISLISLLGSEFLHIFDGLFRRLASRVLNDFMQSSIDITGHPLGVAADVNMGAHFQPRP